MSIENKVIEQEPTEANDKKSKPVSVRIVGQLSGKVIVQWVDDGMVKRSLVSEQALTPGAESGIAIVDEAKLKKAYGDDLMELIADLPDAERIVNRLNNVGIWTYGDVASRPSEVLGAFRAVINDAYIEFVRKAKEKKS